MFELRCTVRRCSERLERRDHSLTCASGHHFDQAKEGYWNLLQPQDRKSKNPGDSDTAVLARHRWLARGYASGLIESIQPWVERTTQRDAEPPPRTLDLGCGEGSFGPALFSKESAGYCGIDLSKRAIKLAARRWPAGTWVLANADRCLPTSDRSVDRVVSLFGRRPASEISRVLCPNGFCIVAVPAEDDLIELRQQVQKAGHRRSRWERVAEEMAEAGLELAEHKRWEHRAELLPDAIADALAMTYRGARHSQQNSLESMTATEVTMSADLLLLRHV
ncbi:putative RNA methyltransferase [Novipirellula artificiosorum]|uniref:23S rRNA (Guanine(745)-N(1))-methyltransferase n=1 Tax=Novipirellula artificiosorum TaxID=2528016 RepID=A0A5C6DDU4_9BACT|nr:methyltransferase domain-containing protein [Novipirellula artificiosorum]TWU34970.1 23S rRNA (guanine(745)-N(1))-methyltransferase [Novipirellula artificiosorum]